jgi:hypothetical protein
VSKKTREKRARKRRAAALAGREASLSSRGVRVAVEERAANGTADGSEAVSPRPRAIADLDRSLGGAPPRSAAPAGPVAPLAEPEPGPPGRTTGRLPGRVSGRVADGIAVGVIVVAAVALMIEAFLFGQVQVERDTYLFYYPLYQWFAEQWRAGHLPLWMPQLFSGYPLFADGELGMLYPPHWVFFGLLPTPAAFIGLRLLHFVLAGAFMYAWMRVLGLRRLAALLAGLTFAYGSFLVGQMHHENLVRTAVWLPLVLCWTEVSIRNSGRRRVLALLAGGATLGVQLTALHVQPALITLMALGLYIGFRTLCPPVGSAAWPVGWGERLRWLGRRLVVGAVSLGTIVGLGGGLALAQLLPLYELGVQTVRGVGAPFAFATTYSVHPTQLVTLLFPYFFRNDRAGSWPLWTGWETFIYVGIAPLVLALVAVSVVRRREVAFFGMLAVLGALLAFGDYSPIPLLEWLWPLPGFSALRVPGRYSLLLVVGLAALAAYGLDWLERVAHAPRRRSLLAVVLGVNGAVIALLVLCVVARQWLLDAPYTAKTVITGTYLAVRRMYRELDADIVYAGLIHSLDLGNRRTDLSIGLLLAVGVLLALCFLVARRAAVWRAGLVLLAAVDLVLWARGFHARQPLAELMRAPPSIEFLHSQGDSLGRLWVSSDRLLNLEYNRPTTWGVTQAGGYSSLEPRRQAEYAAVVANTPGTLLDLWGVRWLAAPLRPQGMPNYKGTAFYPARALFDAGAGNLAAAETFGVPDRPATDVRLIAALSHADELPDREPIGAVIVTATDGSRSILPIMAGLHVSETAHVRGDVRHRVQHRRAEVAHTEMDRDIAGDPYPLHYYYSQLALPEPTAVRSVELRYFHGIGVLRVYGLALGDYQSGQVHQIGPLDRTKFRRVYADRDVQIYENTAAFPRAFVAWGGVLPRPNLGAVYSMYMDPFDPRSEVMLDAPPRGGASDPAGMPPLRGVGDGLPPTTATIQAANIVSYGPERVVIRAATERPAFLVVTDLHHPGWRARVDGVETEVLRADYLFRAVLIGPGDHEIEFVFDPLTVRLGRLGSGLALAILVGALLVAWRWPRGTPRALIQVA